LIVEEKTQYNAMNAAKDRIYTSDELSSGKSRGALSFP
jgi:hypothetical protein